MSSETFPSGTTKKFPLSLAVGSIRAKEFFLDCMGKRGSLSTDCNIVFEIRVLFFLIKNQNENKGNFY